MNIVPRRLLTAVALSHSKSTKILMFLGASHNKPSLPRDYISAAYDGSMLRWLWPLFVRVRIKCHWI